jgi:uncharacterized protein YvpB
MKLIHLPQLFSQWDDRWAKEILGHNSPDSPYNLYNYGCTITCHAMIAQYLGYKESPSSINEKFKKKGGFEDESGYYVWGTMAKLFTKVKDEIGINTPSPLSDDQMNEIKEELDNGNPVMLQIDYNPRTVEDDMHYVLCIGYNPDNENDLLIADPLGGVEKSLKKYLGRFRPSVRESIEQYIIYEVKAPKKSTLKNTVIDFDDPENHRHSVWWYVYEWFNEKVKRLEERKKHEIELHDKDVFAEKVITANEDLTKESTRKESKIQKLFKQVSSQKVTIGQLRTQNASLMDISELFALIWTKIKEKIKSLLELEIGHPKHESSPENLPKID